MKKTTSISFVILATLILFTLSVFPHHHHEGIPCLVANMCERGSNPLPTSDHEESPKHDSNHGHCCKTDVPFIITKLDDQVIQHMAAKIFTSLFFLDVKLADNTVQPLTTKLDDRHTFLLFYHSADVNRLNGLRAPPFPIS